MGVIQTQISPAAQLGTAAAAVATAPVNTTYRISRAGFCNVTAGAVTVTAYVVPSGGSPGVTNEIMSVVNIPANSTYVSPELAGLVLPAGASLQALASAGASIVFYASGVSIQ